MRLLFIGMNSRKRTDCPKDHLMHRIECIKAILQKLGGFAVFRIGALSSVIHKNKDQSAKRVNLKEFPLRHAWQYQGIPKCPLCYGNTQGKSIIRKYR